MSRKHALLVGINYTGSSCQLAGCHNDVLSVRALLERRGWTCRALMDRPLSEQPTRANILRAIAELVANARDGDQLFFHYSGHGTTTRDVSGDDEDDGRDEAICPVDGGIIVDDVLRAALVDPLPNTVSLTVLLDCCYSGTGLDLRYNYIDRSQPLVVTARFPDEYVAREWRHQHQRRENARVVTSRAHVICISGCLDTQTSADTVFDGQPCGAMTAAFLRAWAAESDVSNRCNVRALVQHMCGMLRCYRYAQMPQLSIGDAGTDVDVENGTATLEL